MSALRPARSEPRPYSRTDFPVVLPLGVIVAVLVLSLPTRSLSQIPGFEQKAPPGGHGFVFDLWTTADGLPQNSVNDIVETADGRIWIATFGGLARFDGESFELLTVANTPMLKSNRIMAVREASGGGMWVVTLANELLRFDSDSIVHVIPLPTISQPVAGGLWIEPGGGVWVASVGALHRYEDETWRSFGATEGMRGPINAIEADPYGLIWVATSAGLLRFENERFQMVETDSSIRQEGVVSLQIDAAGRLWLATTAGLAVLDRVEQIVRPVTLVGAARTVGSIHEIGLGREEELWLGGVWGVAHVHVDLEALEARVLYEHESIDSRPIAVIETDDRGSTWVGTTGGGMARFVPRRLWLIQQADGLPVREVNQVVENGEGGVWIASGCNGLANVQVGSGVGMTGVEGRLPDSCTSALWRDRSGSMWVGQRGHLSRVDGREVARTWGPETGISLRGLIGPIIEGASGRIWFGYGSGSLGFVEDSTVQLFEAPIGLPEEPISSMAFDSAGGLWVGQVGTVSRVSLESLGLGEVRVLDRDDGVPVGAIRVIHVDQGGQIWVGSYGGGLTRSVMDGESFHRPLTVEQGMPDNSISALLEDERGRFWILGNEGVSVIRRAVLDSVVEGTRTRVDAVVFGRVDGMPEGNGGNPAGWLDQAGIAWFATINGLAAFDTRAFPPDSIVPVPRIESIRFGGEEWSGEGPIVVGGGATEVSFRYSSSNTASRHGSLYRYRLRGQDDHWVYTEVSGVARYPRIPPGRYLFALEARSENGLWSSEPAVVQFEVLPLWWETAWFQWGTGLLAAVLILVGVMRRLGKVEQRNQQLSRALEGRDLAEERVRRQQRDLEHVTRIATAGELATSLAHELNQPLTAIVSNAAAGNALLSNPHIGKADVREILDEIVDEGRRASDVIKSLRQFLQRGSFESEPLRISQVVREVLLLLRSELRESAIDVRLDLADDVPMVEGNRVQLQQVLVNLIMNAIDAMRDREGTRRLSVRTRRAGDHAEITIRDSGPGLEAGQETRVFEPFVTTKSSGMGVGLAISRTLIGAHGGLIRAGNHPDGGAEFVFTLPSVEAGAVSAEPKTGDPESPPLAR